MAVESRDRGSYGYTLFFPFPWGCFWGILPAEGAILYRLSPYLYVLPTHILTAATQENIGNRMVKNRTLEGFSRTLHIALTVVGGDVVTLIHFPYVSCLLGWLADGLSHKLGIQPLCSKLHVHDSIVPLCGTVSTLHWRCILEQRKRLTMWTNTWPPEEWWFGACECKREGDGAKLIVAHFSCFMFGMERKSGPVAEKELEKILLGESMTGPSDGNLKEVDTTRPNPHWKKLCWKQSELSTCSIRCVSRTAVIERYYLIVVFPGCYGHPGVGCFFVFHLALRYFAKSAERPWRTAT